MKGVIASAVIAVVIVAGSVAYTNHIDKVSRDLGEINDRVMAFLYDGDLMLMDEPFSALDLSTKYKVMQLFLKLWEQKRITAVIVTHDIEEAVFLAKRIVVLGEKGVIKGDFINRGDITRKEITQLFI